MVAFGTSGALGGGASVEDFAAAGAGAGSEDFSLPLPLPFLLLHHGTLVDIPGIYTVFLLRRSQEYAKT